MIELPECFAIKVNREHELWKEYIRWLSWFRWSAFNDNAPEDHYYGVDKNTALCNARHNLPVGCEIITLDEWSEVVKGSKAINKIEENYTI